MTTVDIAHLRHTAAHVLAYAVQDLFPEAKPTIGPAIESGFYYDFDRAMPFTPEDLERLEARMREIVAADYPMVGQRVSREEAIAAFHDNPYKAEIAREIPAGEPITLYTIGGFTDLCRGGHAERTGAIGALKLMSVAGAYWRGDEHNPMLQRIYGTAFPTAQELTDYLLFLEEAAKRDHRKLGAELDLYHIDELAGGGLVFWHPKGALMRGIVEQFIRDGLRERGYLPVVTPHVVHEDLFAISGHLEHFADSMFGPIDVEGQRFRLKPMNCPGHILIYKNSPKSYRDLPVRYAELGNVYRYERSGTMHGLLRVRGFTQDDAHIFCTPGQVEDEVVACIEFAQVVLETFGFKGFQVELSTSDPNAPNHFAGSSQDWATATQSLETALARKGIPYKTIPGEGAFYGPKIDVKLVDVLGRLWQLSTVQFDFNLPGRFGLEYVGEDGERHQPVMVHRALFGSVERFFGVLIEHYAGAFPLWLAPVQVGIVPISERHHEYATNVQQQLQAAGFRVEVDARNEKMNAKIRDFTMQKIPYVLILGDKEEAAGAVSVRTRGKGDGGSRPLDDFLARMQALVAGKSLEL